MTAAHQFADNITEVQSCSSLKYSTAHLDEPVHSTIKQYVAKYIDTWKPPLLTAAENWILLHSTLVPKQKSSSSCCNTPPSNYLEVISLTFICFLHICIPIISFLSVWPAFPCLSGLLFHYSFSLHKSKEICTFPFFKLSFCTFCDQKLYG